MGFSTITALEIDFVPGASPEFAPMFAFDRMACLVFEGFKTGRSLRLIRVWLSGKFKCGESFFMIYWRQSY